MLKLTEIIICFDWKFSDRPIITCNISYDMSQSEGYMICTCDTCLEPLRLKFGNGSKIFYVIVLIVSVVIVSNFITSRLCLGISRTGALRRSLRCLILRKIHKSLLRCHVAKSSYMIPFMCIWYSTKYFHIIVVWCRHRLLFDFILI